MALTSRILGQRGRKQAEKLGVDPLRVPPGQYLTERFPGAHRRSQPTFDLATWGLEQFGEVDRSVRLSWDELMALPQRDVVTDIHCVTRWSKRHTAWRGVPVRDVLERAGVKPSGSHARAYSDGGYTTNMPLELHYDDDVLFAHSYAGHSLEPDHGAPLRLLVPKRYSWKSAKFLRRLEIMSSDRRGFWELNGYHNDADPSAQQRHWF